MSDVMLIPFTDAHIIKTYDWVSNIELQKMFLIRGRVTPEGHTAYFKKTLNDNSQRVFAVTYDEEHIGNCGFKHISLSNHKGEIWIYIGDASLRGKGIGRKATISLLKEGFENLKFDTISLHVADFNYAAFNMYKDLGFLEVQLKDTEDEWAENKYRIICMELDRGRFYKSWGFGGEYGF